jgi:hypothetical protein
MDLLELSADPKRRYMYPAMFKFQFHMIARLDDSCHLRKETVKACSEFNFALTVRLHWSKNVHDE